MFTNAIHDLLAADGTLTALLSTFTPRGASGIPALFSTDPVPEAAELPYVVLTGVVSDEEFDTKGSIAGRDVLFDIRCYTAASGSVSAVDAIAERVRTLLHRQQVSVSGLGWVETIVSGPIVANEDDVYGRILTARLLYSEA